MGDGMKVARDSDNKVLQLSHWKTSKFESGVTTPIQFDTDQTHNVVIVGSSDAFIRVESTSTPAVINEGFPYIGGTYMHTEIKAGEWIGSTSAIHICAIGEAE
jgi:hypothetical protein